MTTTRRAVLGAPLAFLPAAFASPLGAPLITSASIAAAMMASGCAQGPVAEKRPTLTLSSASPPPSSSTSSSTPPSSSPSQAPPPLPAGLREGEQGPWSLPETASSSADPDSQPYRRMQIAVPAGYAAATRPWPLLVFLHGAGERGFDVEDVKRCGPPMRAARGQAYPMIVCSPQADPGTRWQPARLHALVAALGTQFDIDPRRVLATGLSLGGSGSWRWACAFPDDLAAIAPVCGFVDPAAVASMRRIPVRAYHGDQDPFVPIGRQQACVTELQRLGGRASFTIYPGVGHDSWTAAYEDPGLLPWLLGQARA